MRYKAPDSGGKYVLFLLLCRHVGLLFGKRLGTDLLRHRIKKNPDTCGLDLKTEENNFTRTFKTARILY